MISTEILFDFEGIKSIHLIIVLLGYLIVFISLSMLWGIFHYLPVILHFNWKKKANKEPLVDTVKKDDITGEEAAAISAALYLFIGEMHDDEARVLTVQKISRRYSPWSSKIYNVINGLNKRF